MADLGRGQPQRRQPARERHGGYQRRVDRGGCQPDPHVGEVRGEHVGAVPGAIHQPEVRRRHRCSLRHVLAQHRHRPSPALGAIFHRPGGRRDVSKEVVCRHVAGMSQGQGRQLCVGDQGTQAGRRPGAIEQQQHLLSPRFAVARCSGAVAFSFVGGVATPFRVGHAHEQRNVGQDRWSDRTVAHHLDAVYARSAQRQRHVDGPPGKRRLGDLAVGSCQEDLSASEPIVHLAAQPSEMSPVRPRYPAPKTIPGQPLYESRREGLFSLCGVRGRREAESNDVAPARGVARQY